MWAILILFGLVFGAVGAYGSRRQYLLRRKGQRVTGTVSRIDREWHSGDANTPGHYTYFPVLSFRTLAGQPMETRSAVGGSSLGEEAGESVRVIYDPADPSFAEVDTFGTQASAVLVPLICLAAGIGLIVGGIVTMTGR